MHTVAVSLSRPPSLADLRQQSLISSGFLLPVHREPKKESDHSCPSGDGGTGDLRFWRRGRRGNAGQARGKLPDFFSWILFERSTLDGREKWSRSKGSGRYADTNVVSRAHLSELWQEDCREHCTFQPEGDTAEGCWSLQKDSTTGRVTHTHCKSFA